MRALLACAVLAPLVSLVACTPDIVSGAYVCGPEKSCPDGQTCNGADDEDAGLVADTCVLGSLSRPFACESDLAEPDDTAAQSSGIPMPACVSSPFIDHGCMGEGDPADWVTFVAPSVCTAVEVQVRLSFPIAYEQLAFEVWDVDHDMKLGSDGECASSVDDASIRRCLDQVLVPGTKYGVKVVPNGQGTCDGSCAYNRYTLSVQLATPG